MNKYLFMDIDGVLNHEEWFRTPGVKEKEMPYCWYDPKCVSLINEIVEKSGCKIIVTSDHRLDIRLHQFFKQVDLPTDFDCTPVFWDESRGREIEYWLEKHAKEPYIYAILDDCNDMLENQQNHLFQTAESKWDQELMRHNGGLGITEIIKERVIKKLNNYDNSI